MTQQPDILDDGTTSEADPAPYRSRAWPAFQEALGDVLEALDEDQFLILQSKRHSYFVQFAGQGHYGLRAETVSNRLVEPPDRLDRERLAQLAELGWHPPTGSLEGSTPQSDPDGSPNHFIDIEPPIDGAAVASMVVSTLVDVLRIPHPGELRYKAFTSDGTAVLFPSLGLDVEAPGSPSEGDTFESVRADVRMMLRHLADDDDIDYDETGMLRTALPGALIAARVVDEPLFVRIWALVLSEVPEDDDLLTRLSELNGRLQLATLTSHDGMVLAQVDLFAFPFAYQHVAHAVSVLRSTVQQVASLLQEEFGGRDAGGDWKPPPNGQDPGAYL